MPTVKKSESSSLYIASDPPMSGSMTVGALRRFVAALDEHEVPDKTTLESERHHDTMHFIGLRVRVTESREVPLASPEREVS